MTCGTDRESCESDPECPADQCAPAWGPFEALFAARDAVTSDAISACGTLARSPRRAPVRGDGIPRVLSSRLSLGRFVRVDASAREVGLRRGDVPRGARLWVSARARWRSSCALDVDGVGPCSLGARSTATRLARAAGTRMLARRVRLVVRVPRRSAANACADHAPDRGARSSVAAAEAVGASTTSLAPATSRASRRPPYPGYVGCQLECEGVRVARGVREQVQGTARGLCEGGAQSRRGRRAVPRGPARARVDQRHARRRRPVVRRDVLGEPPRHHPRRPTQPRVGVLPPRRPEGPRRSSRTTTSTTGSNAGNRIDADFEMYSTYDAALKRDPARRWTHCGGGQESERPGYGFPGECFPSVEAYWEHQDAIAAGSPLPPERRVRVATDSPSYESKGCRLRTAKGKACVTGRLL